jgi:hypothetical protein
MMYVMSPNGDFAVYIDRRWTSLPQEVFNTLPTMEGIKPLAFCEAAWCNGPAPTPTPTGSSPLELIVFGSTPPAIVNPAELNKTLISWNNVRVGYVLDDPLTKTYRVTLEVCAEPEQITCEASVQVFDNSVGLAKPVVSQVNGLNVYEFSFPYGYKTNLVIEGDTLYSTDVWFSEPPWP